ncbi:MAG: c-type cytochrome, partial [candidate division NC10 bacterium]|nr:c-type cytochrome [candidate division NC10 bacterium]
DRGGFEDAPPPFQSHPNRLAIFSKHPVAQFGCTGCHEGQGTALEVALAHRPKKYWERPLLKAEMTQATCLRCHRGQTEWVMAVPTPAAPAPAAPAAGEAQAAEVQPAALVDLAPALSRGILLLETLGCFGCHNIRGYETAEKVGPDLTRIGAKVQPAWLVRWIQKPEGYLPHTRMPSFGLSEKEATAIAAYLLKHSEPAPRAPGTYSPAAPAARGRELFQQAGCYGCHQLRGLDGEAKPSTFSAQVQRDFAPDLSQVATKVSGPGWLFAWLKDPKAFRPTTPMPSLRLSDAEASALANFLLTLGKREPIPPGLQAELANPEVIEEGRRLIGKRGCFGCHEIRGFEKAEKIAPDLSNFANKRLLELFFGDATHVPETWEDYTFWKLKQPDIYATERIEQIMPNFRLSDEQPPPRPEVQLRRLPRPGGQGRGHPGALRQPGGCPASAHPEERAAERGGEGPDSLAVRVPHPADADPAVARRPNAHVPLRVQRGSDAGRLLPRAGRPALPDAADLRRAPRPDPGGGGTAAGLEGLLRLFLLPPAGGAEARGAAGGVGPRPGAGPAAAAAGVDGEVDHRPPEGPAGDEDAELLSRGAG